MSGDELVVVGAWLATDGPLKGHPDFRIPTDHLPRIADAVRGQSIPIQVDHDDRTRMPEAKVLSAEVREIAPGRTGVWAEVEIPWWVPEQRRGLSPTFSLKLTSIDTAQAPRIALTADVINFGEGLALEAAQSMSKEFAVEVALLYQLEAAPPAKVIMSLARDVLSALTDNRRAAILRGLERFVRPGTPTEFRFDVRDDGKTTVALVKTDDSDLLGLAVYQLDTLPRRSGMLEFDTDSGGFQPINAGL